MGLVLKHEWKVEGGVDRRWRGGGDLNARGIYVKSVVGGTDYEGSSLDQDTSYVTDGVGLGSKYGCPS